MGQCQDYYAAQAHTLKNDCIRVVHIVPVNQSRSVIRTNNLQKCENYIWYMNSLCVGCVYIICIFIY